LVCIIDKQDAAKFFKNCRATEEKKKKEEATKLKVWKCGLQWRNVHTDFVKIRQLLQKLYFGEQTHCQYDEIAYHKLN
jgi:hypothetical protein